MFKRNIFVILIIFIIFWLFLFNCSISKNQTEDLTSKTTVSSHGTTSTTIVYPATTTIPVIDYGNKYYVDFIAGLDTNNGSINSPWKYAPGDRNATGNAALTVLIAGDTVYFRGGVVYRGCIKLRISGSSAHKITYSGSGWGTGLAILQPPTSPNPSLHEVDGFEVYANDVIIKGFLIQNFEEYGVEVRHDTAPINVSIIDCEITNSGSGVMLGGSYGLVQRCYFHDMIMIVNDVATDNDYGAVGVWIEGMNNSVLDNRFVNCIDSSIDYGTDGGAVEIFGTIDGSIIMRNQASNCNGFIEAGSSGTGTAFGVTVAYNLSVDNGPFCIIHGNGIFSIRVSDFRIDNNTVVDNRTAQSPALFSEWALLVFPGITDSSTILVRNNIFIVRDVQWISPANSQGWSFTHSQNIYYMTNINSRTGFIINTGERIIDPQLVNPIGNYDLQTGSPARNSGLQLGYLSDLLGRQVPTISNPSIGAMQTP